MVSVRMCLVVILASCLPACTSLPPFESHQQISPKFRIDIRDVPEGNAFAVKLISEDTRTMCLSREQWPRSDGSLHGPEGRAFLLLGARKIASKNNYFGHCRGSGCAIVIPPGETLTGLVSYSNFGEIMEDAGTKRLDFEVSPWMAAVCK